MARMTFWTAGLTLTLVLALAGGCASPTSDSGASRVRCVDSPSRNDPRIESTRPMFFLFCIQS